MLNSSIQKCVLIYQVVPKVLATTILLHVRNKWFPPLCRASIFRKVQLVWPDCFIAFLEKEKSFHNHVCPCFRYDDGEDGLAPLYLVTRKVSEDENFRIGTICDSQNRKNVHSKSSGFSEVL